MPSPLVEQKNEIISPTSTAPLFIRRQRVGPPPASADDDTHHRSRSRVTLPPVPSGFQLIGGAAKENAFVVPK